MECYFTPLFTPAALSLDAAVDAIDDAVRESIEKQTQGEGVGALLSSGVDSSYVAACFKPAKTFTVGFEHAKYNEITYAKTYADAIGAAHVSKTVSDWEAAYPPRNLPAGARVTRFAPSPTGRMHAGNVLAALVAWLEARCSGGEVVLRIEDLDTERSRREHADALQRDFEYLGLHWDIGPIYQSERVEAYQEALSRLERQGLTYPCFCTRADIHAASAPHAGEKPVYAGTCRRLSADERAHKLPQGSAALRLAVPGRVIAFTDCLQGAFTQDLPSECGDFIVQRSDGNYAYQLAVVVDDAEQGIGSVVRACDLLGSTPQQIYLQELLGYGRPEYCHVPLLVDTTGRRLSKRNRDADMEALSARFKTPEALIGHIAALAGLIAPGEHASPQELTSLYSRTPLKGVSQILWA
jgi:glutamyl-tRNA synthetase